MLVDYVLRKFIRLSQEAPTTRSASWRNSELPTLASGTYDRGCYLEIKRICTTDYITDHSIFVCNTLFFIREREIGKDTLGTKKIFTIDEGIFFEHNDCSQQDEV